HPRQRLELAERNVPGLAPHHHVAELLEQGLGLLLGLADQGPGHQRGGGDRYGAAGAVEADVADDAALVGLEVERDLVAAQRIAALRLAIRAGDLAAVTRVAVVIEDDLLVEVLQVAHRLNISMTLPMPSASRSISSLVLY